MLRLLLSYYHRYTSDCRLCFLFVVVDQERERERERKRERERIRRCGMDGTITIKTTTITTTTMITTITTKTSWEIYVKAWPIKDFTLHPHARSGRRINHNFTLVSFHLHLGFKTPSRLVIQSQALRFSSHAGMLSFSQVVLFSSSPCQPFKGS